MVESEGAFRLTFVQGRGLLSLAGRDFEGLGRVDSLELEIPNLRFPFDLSGGVARFKNRRLRLRELALFVSSRELTGFLAKAPLAEFGIYDPRVTVSGSRLTLCARVLLGGHESEITAVALVSPQPPRSAGLCVYDVRAYGFLPIPVPLVVTALFSALGAESPANLDPEVALPPLLHIRSASDIRIDVCELAMLAILAHARVAAARAQARANSRRRRRRQGHPRAARVFVGGSGGTRGSVAGRGCQSRGLSGAGVRRPLRADRERPGPRGHRDRA
jgi:hypothetical protein